MAGTKAEGGVVVKTLRLFVVIIFTALSARTAGADTAILTVLHNFGGTITVYGRLDGSTRGQPPIEGSDGNVYGTT